MSKSNALFIGYARLEELIDAARSAVNTQTGPLAQAQCFAMASTTTQAGYPVARVSAQVYFLTPSGQVHYWRCDLAEYFYPPLDPNDRKVLDNAMAAYDIIHAALLASGLRPTTGQIAAPKDVRLLSGDFSGLKFDKTNLWQPTAEPVLAELLPNAA